jgi:hypothetical protein
MGAAAARGLSAATPGALSRGAPRRAPAADAADGAVEGRHGRSAPPLLLEPARELAVDRRSCASAADNGPTDERETPELEFAPHGLGGVAVRGRGRGSDGGSDGSGASASAAGGAAAACAAGAAGAGAGAGAAAGANDGAERRSRDSAAFVRDVRRRDDAAGTGEVERGGAGDSSAASGCSSAGTACSGGGSGRLRATRSGGSGGGGSGGAAARGCGGSGAGRAAGPGACALRLTPLGGGASGGSRGGGGGGAAWLAARVVSAARRSFSAASFNCAHGGW